MTKKGFSIVEIVLAAALFAIFSVGAVGLVVQGLEANRLAAEQAIANQFAAEGLEMARAVRNQNFSGLSGFSGTNNTFEKYTRTIASTSVDADTYKITSTVSWAVKAGRNNSVVLNTYLTNWRKAIATIGNWANPNSLAGTLDLTGTQAGLKIAVSGSYAYVIRAISGGANFLVINISNPASPILAGSLTTTGTPADIFVAGNYAYLSTNDSNAELKIINITNPAAPSLASAFNLPGNTQTTGVYVLGTTAYLSRNASSQNEFYIINVSNPTSPSITGSLNLSASTNDVKVLGNYAFLATANTIQQLQVINITIPAAPTLAGSVQLGTVAATKLELATGLAVVSAGSNVYLVNISTPTTPSQTGVYAAGGAVNDLSLGNNNTYAFLATSNTASELQVLDISNPASPSLVGIYNDTGNYNVIAYDGSSDRVYAATSITTGEVRVIAP